MASFSLVGIIRCKQLAPQGDGAPQHLQHVQQIAVMLTEHRPADEVPAIQGARHQAPGGGALQAVGVLKRQTLILEIV